MSSNNIWEGVNLETVEALNANLSEINPIEVEVGTRSYNITGIELSIWEKAGHRRLYVRPRFSWDDPRYQFLPPYIDLVSSKWFSGSLGGFVDSHTKRDAAKEAQREMVRVVRAELEKVKIKSEKTYTLTFTEDELHAIGFALNRAARELKANDATNLLNRVEAVRDKINALPE